MTICTQYNHLPVPNYCQVPNILLDEWISKLGHAEFKIIMYMCRKTFGWHKTSDRISLSQIEKATGFVRNHITRAIKSLCEKGLLRKLKTGEKGTEKSYYEVILIEDSNNSYQYLKDTGGGILKIPTKETITKEIISPIVPKRDSPRRIKKEEKKERAERVLTTDSQHQDLLKRANGDINLVTSWYDRLSTWKISKEIHGGTRDYKNIVDWVIEAVKEKPLTKTKIIELEEKKKEEQRQMMKKQEEAIQALKEKKRLEEQAAFNEKLKANLPILEKYMQKYASVIKVYGLESNGLYEINDKKGRSYIYPFTEDNFEVRLEAKLRDIGAL